jgi:DNA-binding CsgD family transcriptional regulator
VRVGLATVRERAYRDIQDLVPRGLGARDFTEAALRSLRRAVHFDGTCLLTTDPATQLPTSEFVERGLPPCTRARLTEIEFRERDFNKFTALARDPRPAASLSQVTGGALERSLRQRELRGPSGFADELRVALRDQTGVWGALTLLRSAGRAHFSPAEVRLLGSLAGPLADGLRRAAVLGAAAPVPDLTGRDPGLLVLAPDDEIELINGEARRRLAELDGAGRYGSVLPVVVRTVAQRVRASADPGAGRCWARVRTPAGRWMVVRGSFVGDSGLVGILVEPAGSPELAPLIADAYGLNGRERRVTELVAQGLSTNDIGARLHLSAYTVQDHLKAIFGKTGSGSRGDLVARLFFEHYVPQLTTTAISTMDDAEAVTGAG